MSNYAPNRLSLETSVKNLKDRLKHHAKVAHAGEADDKCIGCTELKKLIKMREAKENK